ARSVARVAALLLDVFQLPAGVGGRVWLVTALASVLPDSRIAGVRSLRSRVRLRGCSVRRGRRRPVGLLMAGEAQGRLRIVLDEELLRDRIDVLLVRIVTAAALQHAVVVELHRIAGPGCDDLRTR